VTFSNVTGCIFQFNVTYKCMWHLELRPRIHRTLPAYAIYVVLLVLIQFCHGFGCSCFELNITGITLFYR